MTNGTIFDIKGFALNDGPGIRTTVFLKGCPLRCAWCHNPEGLSPKPELRVKAGCTGCGTCRVPCDHADCRPYGRCLHVCPNGKLSAAGTVWSAEDLAAHLEKDRDVFGDDGGVTFSGGEPLMQADFVAECALLLRQKGIHTALETSSFAPAETYRKVVSAVDLVLADVKLMDTAAHRKYCGQDNGQILENLAWLMESGKDFVFRVPLIPGITDTDENLAAISAFIGSHRAELLPYNEMAGAKYASVGREFAMGKKAKQNEEKKKHILALFENAVVR